MTDTFHATQRNLRLSRVVVLIAFAITAGSNFLLVGFFARLGGIVLVGDWASVNTVVMTTLIADMGLTSALTFRMGRDSVAAGVPLLRRLLLIAGFVGAGIIAATAMLAAAAGLRTAAFGVALLAGLFQLSSNWTIAIRLGQHEQYWFYIKVILRVLAQGILAVALYFAMPSEALFAFAVAFACASLIELGFARFLTSADRVSGPRADLAELRELVRGFGPLTIMDNGLPPLFQIAVLALSGNAALGYFTVAWRLPAVVTQAVSEALRGLLPGLAALSAKGDQGPVVQLLRDALVGQIVLVGSGLIVLAAHAGLIYQVWLGHAAGQTVNAFYCLAFGAFVASVSAPFFWAVQAYGSSALLSRFWGLRLAVALMLGAMAYWISGSDFAFPSAFATALFVGAASIFFVAHSHHRLLFPVLSLIRWTRIGIFYALFFVLNVFLQLARGSLESLFALGLIASINLIVIAATAWAIRRRAIFVVGQSHVSPDFPDESQFCVKAAEGREDG